MSLAHSITHNPSTPMHPLDNVIWQALNTRQTEFAEVFAHARRFAPDVTSLGGLAEPSSDGYANLAALLNNGGVAALFLDQRYEPRPGLTVIAEAPLLEMVWENAAATQAGRTNSVPEITPLGSKDSEEMVALTALTKPGPFGSRTHELGTYLGIHCDGKLVAMAGERLKVPGYTEVSAVCTHPDYVGKGYARVLMLEVMRGIRERGEIPMLHVRQNNARAVELYERLGFRSRVVLHLAVLKKS